MKKKLKKFAMFALTLLLMWSTLVPTYAASTEDDIVPLMNTNITAKCLPSVSSSGFLTVTNTYAVTDSRVDKVKITTYVEKRSLLVIWNRVDIGTTNDEWVAYGGNGTFSKTHSAQMPSSGTYRVTATFEVFSGNTLLDSFDLTSTVSY